MSEPEPVAVRCAWCDWHVWLDDPGDVYEIEAAEILLRDHLPGHRRTFDEWRKATASKEHTA